jgi:hypothetical protein
MKKLISLTDLSNLKPETLSQIKNISFYTKDNLFFNVLKVFCDVENKDWFKNFMVEFNDQIYKQVTIYNNIKKNELGDIKFNLYMGRHMYYPYTMALKLMLEMTKFVKDFYPYFSNNEVSLTLYFSQDIADKIYLEYEFKNSSKELVFTKFVKD